MFGETQAVVGSVEECRSGLVGRHVAGTLQAGGVNKSLILSARLFLLDNTGSESQRDHRRRAEEERWRLTHFFLLLIWKKISITEVPSIITSMI